MLDLMQLIKPLDSRTGFSEERPDNHLIEERLVIVRPLSGAPIEDTRAPGNIYKISYLGDDVESYLDYDNLMLNQLSNVRDKLRDAGITYSPDDTGRDVYYTLAGEVGGEFRGGQGSKGLSKQHGVKGFRYIDPIEASYTSHQNLDGLIITPPSIPVSLR
jgi:hypothetical protein